MSISISSSGSKTRATRRVLAAAITSALVLAGGAAAQGTPDTVKVAFRVAPADGLTTVKATVTPGSGAASTCVGMERDITPKASGRDTLLLISTADNTAVLHGAQRQNVAALVNYSRGNVSLKLSALHYGDASVSLHSVNGKRIMHGKASASKGALLLSRSNVAPGVYLLSVKGKDGSAYSTRVAHSGGKLNINAGFGNGHTQTLAKSAAVGDCGTWTLTLTADGFKTETRNITLGSGGVVDLSSITMNKVNTGGDGEVYHNCDDYSGTDAYKKNPPPTVRANFTETVGNTSFEMIYIPGTNSGFTMGGSGAPSAGTVNVTKLSPYFIMKNEVSSTLWRAVLGNNYTPNSPGQATWYDAMVFACKLSEMTGKNYRMMTEAEFEYAAKNHMSSLSGINGGISGEEWAYNSWEATYSSASGGVDPIGPCGSVHTQKTRRDVSDFGDNATGRLIRSIEGFGPATRLTLSADVAFPPGYVPPCLLHAPEAPEEGVNSYRDMRWVTGGDSRWENGAITIGTFSFRAWEDGTAQMGSTNGQWFTSNNITLVFVPSSGTARKFPYIFVDANQVSLISDLGFMNGGFIGRSEKKTTSSVAKPTVTLAASAKALAEAQPEFNTYFKMVDMVNMPQSVRGQDSRLLDGTDQGWFQDNTNQQASHHYRKDVDLDEFRFTVNQGTSTNGRTMLANGTWFTINNTFLRVTHPNNGKPYSVDYLYAVTSGSNPTFYHNSFMAYERGDFRMFEKKANNTTFPCGSLCNGEIPKNQAVSPYAPGGFMANGHSTFEPAPCPTGGCN